jgi:hypothetical protein
VRVLLEYGFSKPTPADDLPDPTALIAALSRGSTHPPGHVYDEWIMGMIATRTMRWTAAPGERKTSIARGRRLWWSLPPLLAAALAYSPILLAYFVADDFRSFVMIADRGPRSFLFEQFGSHALLVRNALWVLWYRLFGLAAGPYMWAALLTHLLNVWLLWLTLDRLTRRPGLAALGAGWWGASPLHVGTLGWYSVYGHVLVGTFVLSVLAHASAVVPRGRFVTFGMAVGWTALLALAANSFGTGVGAAIAVPLALLFCLRSDRIASRAARVLLLGAPLWAVLDYLGMRAISQRAPAIDSVAIFRTSWWNLNALVDQARMLAGLVEVGLGALLTGHVVPFDQRSPSIWLYSVACLAGLAIMGAGARRADPGTRRWIVAQLGVALAIYAIIAVGRGSVARIFYPTPEAAASGSRYHYAATLPLTVASVLALAVLLRRERIRTALPLLAGLAVALQVGAWWRWGPVIPSHSEARTFVAHAQRRIAVLARAAPAATEVRIGNVPAPPAVMGLVDPADFPGWAGVFVITQPADEVAGHRVVFAEPSARTRNAHRAPASRRLSRLLVPPPLQLGATCDLSAALRAIHLGRELLACPLGAPAGEACATALRRRSVATAAGRQCQCADPGALADRVSVVVAVARTLLSCPAAATGGDDACPRHVLRRLGVLVSELGACCREAIVSHRGLADAACVERATARYSRQVRALGPPCTACFDVRALGLGARKSVLDLLDGALCRTLAPGAVTYELAGPTATPLPVGGL